MLPSMLQSGLGALFGEAEFILPLTDLGAGLVNTQPMRAKGSATFVRATTATTIGSTGLVVAVASGAARSHYATDGTYLGYLAEGARTNRCLQSQTFEDAAWVVSNVTKTDNDAVAPDGTSTAALLLATGANGTVIQDLGVVASASKTGSLWIKRKTGTGDIDLTMDDGAGWTTQAVTTTWTRFSLNQTLANEGFGIRIVTDTDAVWVWNGQVETGAFESSDIPTTTVAVARNADVLTYASAGNTSATQGTVYAEGTQPVLTAAPTTLVSLDDGTLNERMQLYLTAASSNKAGRLYVADGGVAQADIASGVTLVAGAVNKNAYSYKANDFEAVVNGASIGSDTSGTLPTVTRIGIGVQANNQGQADGTIRNARIWQRQLTDAQLQALTA